jgi:hypothetical protein
MTSCRAAFAGILIERHEFLLEKDDEAFSDLAVLIRDTLPGKRMG